MEMKDEAPYLNKTQSKKKKKSTFKIPHLPKENQWNKTKHNTWNCRGIKPNYEEIKCIMTNYNPNIICLQETLLNETDNISFKGLQYL